jgi:Tropomyosin
LEVSEEKANQRVEEFKRQLKTLTVKLKEAENRAELAEKTVKKLQKEVDRLEGIYTLPIASVRLCVSETQISSLFSALTSVFYYNFYKYYFFENWLLKLNTFYKYFSVLTLFGTNKNKKKTPLNPSWGLVTPCQRYHTTAHVSTRLRTMF